jgi:hypothetical protein
MMKKLILASAAAVALFGVAACSDTDTSTTQSVEPSAQTTPAPTDPAVTPAPQAPATDEGAAEEMKPATPAPSE